MQEDKFDKKVKSKIALKHKGLVSHFDFHPHKFFLAVQTNVVSAY